MNKIYGFPGFFLLFMAILSSCSIVPSGEDVEFISFLDEKSQALKKNSIDTFHYRRTYYVGEEGEYSVLSSCTDSSRACEAMYKFKFSAPQEPGVYWAIGITNEGQKTSFPIYVIEKHKKKACLLIPTFTMQAYNKVGGKSFYSTPYDKSITLSLNRPIKASWQNPHGYSVPGYHLLNNSGIDAHVIDDYFLHENSNWIEKSCDYLVVSGHSEYWSSSIYSDIKSYIENGNSVLNMSGNIGYWRMDVAGKDAKITINKNKKYLKQYRLKLVDPDVSNLFGVYYLGYPLLRILKDNKTVLDNYPLLSDYPFDELQVVNRKHEFFKCLGKGVNQIPAEALKVELDGVLLKNYKKGEDAITTIKNIDDVDGSILKTWVVYGTSVREIVVARDYQNEFGGRIISFGSIGWARAAINNEVVSKISTAAIRSLSGLPFDCDVSYKIK